MSSSSLNKYSFKLMVKCRSKLLHIKCYHKVSAPVKFTCVFNSVELSGKFDCTSVERLLRTATVLRKETKLRFLAPLTNWVITHSSFCNLWSGVICKNFPPREIVDSWAKDRLLEFCQ